MPYRFGYYIINSHINDVWDNTLAFWQNKRSVKITNSFISENSFYRELKVKHGMSVHAYGTSIREIYEMTFGYDPSERKTYVSVEVFFSWAGRGFIWLVPQNVMKSWALEMGILPKKLLHKKDEYYSEKFNQICNYSGQERIGEKVNFCPICGNQLSIHCKFCAECGTNLQVI
ncbi:MAG: hypothetical protein ACFFC9_04720 [Promethearchaeota archaeon]